MAALPNSITTSSSTEHFKKIHHLCGQKRLHVGFFVDLRTDVVVDEAGTSTPIRQITAFSQCTHNDGCLATCSEIELLRQALAREHTA